MRFLVLILSVLFVPSLYAGEKWGLGFTADHVGVASVAQDYEIPPPIIDGIEVSKASFIVYFKPRSMCFPVIFILQLRVDEREVYRPPTVKWQEDLRGVWVGFLEATDTTKEKALERVKVVNSLLRDVMEGNSIRAKLEPSGKVMRWSLRGSREAIQGAERHCRAGVEDQQYFPE